VQDDHVLDFLQSAKPTLEHLLPVLNNIGIRSADDLERIMFWERKNQEAFFMKLFKEKTWGLTRLDIEALCILFANHHYY
jgi:hypothetical protein